MWASYGLGPGVGLAAFVPGLLGRQTAARGNGAGDYRGPRQLPAAVHEVPGLSVRDPRAVRLRPDLLAVRAEGSRLYVMAKGMPARDNSREGKASMLYDGHNRKPGVSAGNAALRWRRLRRRMRRWLSDRFEVRP